MNRKVITSFAAILILGGFGFLIWGGLGNNLVYFLTPSELLARGEAAYETPVRLGGKERRRAGPAVPGHRRHGHAPGPVQRRAAGDVQGHHGRGGRGIVLA